MNLIFIGLISVPALTSAAELEKLAFPVLSLAFALYLLWSGRLTQYITFCIWLFLLTPGVRRIVDLQSGWSAINPLMLSPYLAASPVLGVVLGLLGGKRPLGAAAFLSLTAVVTYGLFLAEINGRVLSGLYDFLRWMIPPCFGMFLALNRRHMAEISSSIIATFVLALPLLGLYGIYQFVYAPPWDTYWMINSKMNSIGSPEPFQIRVFSTLNSPGSFASVVMFGLVLLLTTKGVFRWVGISIGMAVFTLTLVRSSWIGFGICAAVILAASPLRAGVSAAVLALAAFLAAPLVLSHPEVTELLMNRVQSLTDISSDVSYNARSSSYSSFLEDFDQHLLGQGLGVNGTYQSYSDGGQVQIIDGGPIEIFLALGVVGGLIYLGSIGVLSMLALRVKENGIVSSGLILGCKALVIANLVLLSSGTTTVGEIGLFFWIPLGLLLASHKSTYDLDRRENPS